LHIM